MKKLNYIKLTRITPIDHNEIKEHQKQYLDKVKRLTEEKAKKREEEETK